MMGLLSENTYAGEVTAIEKKSVMDKKSRILLSENKILILISLV